MRWQRAAHGIMVAALAILHAGPAARAAAAAQHREELTYSFDIDPGEWRYFEFPVKEKDARLEVRFEVRARHDSPGIRVAVMTQEEFRRFRDNLPHHDIGASDPRAEERSRRGWRSRASTWW
jgi:spore coat polysaccharide biosynthesis protein SpsF (cytidylyltransferase family)